MQNSEFDLAIIGAGPGGYVAAIHAAQHGLKVALIEAWEVGGVCLNAGCIPTKAMLASVDLLRQMRMAASLGISAVLGESPLEGILARRQKVVQQLVQGVRYLLEKNQIELIHGHGFLKSASEIEVRDKQGNPLRTINHPRAILLATGSHPTELAAIPRDGSVILNSNDLLNLTELPRELVIIGGGYIGCEFAGVFVPLGSRVTIIEGLSRLLPGLDKELGQALERSFTKAGIKVLLNTQVTRVETDNGVKVMFSDDQSIPAAKVLVAVGRSPNLENLGLENAGLVNGPRGLPVNDFMQTNVPHIYAIGDVTGKMALAHVASAQGKIAVNHMRAALGGSHTPDPATGQADEHVLNYEAVPACVFTHPEIATVGLAEDEAVKRGIKVRTSRFPFAATGKAQASGEVEGFVKIVAETSSGRIMGGHIFGPNATELIAPLALAMQWGITAGQLARTVFAHPTLSEAIVEAAEGIIGKPTHLFVRR